MTNLHCPACDGQDATCDYLTKPHVAADPAPPRLVDALPKGYLADHRVPFVPGPITATAGWLEVARLTRSEQHWHDRAMEWLARLDELEAERDLALKERDELKRKVDHLEDEIARWDSAREFTSDGVEVFDRQRREIQRLEADLAQERVEYAAEVRAHDATKERVREAMQWREKYRIGHDQLLTQRDAALAEVERLKLDAHINWEGPVMQGQFEEMRENARGLAAALREAIKKHCECDECGAPGTRYFTTEGDGPFWLCDSTDEHHAMPGRYAGEEVDAPNRPFDAAREALARFAPESKPEGAP